MNPKNIVKCGQHRLSDSKLHIDINYSKTSGETTTGQMQ